MAVAGTARWTWIWPALAWTILLITFVMGGGGFVYAAAGIALFGTVFAAVYHAEMVAHRVGEPFGTLVLALAVTVIETALIVSVMIAAPAEKAGLARDTVFAAVMIVCNGIVGACLLGGGARHHEQGFQTQGASAALAVLVALTSLTMVLPNLAAQELGPLYNKPQLIFAGLVSLILYFAFVFIQTVRHRDYFLPVKTSNSEEHVSPPDNRTTALSAILLVVSLVAVVGLEAGGTARHHVTTGELERHDSSSSGPDARPRAAGRRGIRTQSAAPCSSWSTPSVPPCATVSARAR